MGAARRIVDPRPSAYGELARELRSEDVRDAIPTMPVLTGDRTPWAGEAREAVDQTVKKTITVAGGATYRRRGICELRRSWAIFGAGIDVGALAQAASGVWTVTVNAYVNNSGAKYLVLTSAFDPSSLASSDTPSQVIGVQFVGARITLDLLVTNRSGAPHTFSGVRVGLWGSNANL